MDFSLIRLKNIFISPLFVGIAFFLFFQFQFFNLNIDFRDEGLLLSNAVKINHGEIPYRDFPLTTTPGAYYIQGFVMKLFGNYIISDRVIYIICIIAILILSYKLFKLPLFVNYIFLISLSILYIGKRAYSFYNIEGLVLILASYFLFNKLQLKSSVFFYSFLIGLLNSLVFIIKQSYGGVFLLIFLFLIIFFTERKMLIKNLLTYLAGVLLILCSFLLYFYLNEAFDKLIYYVFFFSRIVKNHRIPFVLTSLLFIPFFYFVFNILRKLSLKRIFWTLMLFLIFFIIYLIISPARISRLQIIYKDFLIYYYLLFLTIPIIVISLYLKNKNNNRKQFITTSILALSLFLTSALSGRDYTTVIMVAPLYVPLFFFFLSYSLKRNKLFTRNVIILSISVLYILPSVISLGKTYSRQYGWLGMDKEIYLSSDIVEMKYIKIPKKEKEDLDGIIFYIKKDTSSLSKMICFPYCPMLNFLAGRNSASYFNFFYPETFIVEDQIRVISDLKKNNKLTIFIQKKGIIEKEANYEDKRLKVLKQFMISNYKLIKSTQNFIIYGK